MSTHKSREQEEVVKEGKEKVVAEEEVVEVEEKEVVEVIEDDDEEVVEKEKLFLLAIDAHTSLLKAEKFISTCFGVAEGLAGLYNVGASMEENWVEGQGGITGRPLVDNNPFRRCKDHK